MRSNPTLNRDEILSMVRGFQPACVVIAAADLDLFTLLHRRPMNAGAVARAIEGDVRGVAILLDALSALGLLRKASGRNPVYRVPAAVARTLTETGSQCVLGMVRHQGNCLRRWGRLAEVVKQGRPASQPPSVRGAEGDLASFIRAMHEISTPMAEPLLGSLGRVPFTHVLDLGGASGTWTTAFLRLNPTARATIFDRPDVIPMARRLMKRAGLLPRVRLVAGNFETGRLPTGADLAWVSAIVHQNSRAENRALFGRVYRALEPGGRILIRDILVDATRTRPVGGALFAVNMLAATRGGGTFTLAELREDLSAAGFVKPRLLRRGEWMDSVVCAVKPARQQLAARKDRSTKHPSTKECRSPKPQTV